MTLPARGDAADRRRCDHEARGSHARYPIALGLCYAMPGIDIGHPQMQVRVPETASKKHAGSTQDGRKTGAGVCRYRFRGLCPYASGTPCPVLSLRAAHASAYARAMRCPVLTRACWRCSVLRSARRYEAGVWGEAMCGAELAYGPRRCTSKLSALHGERTDSHNIKFAKKVFGKANNAAMIAAQLKAEAENNDGKLGA
eukprot:2398018-Rhodomonas_salina.2